MVEINLNELLAQLGGGACGHNVDNYRLALGTLMRRMGVPRVELTPEEMDEVAEKYSLEEIGTHDNGQGAYLGVTFVLHAETKEQFLEREAKGLPPPTEQAVTTEG